MAKEKHWRPGAKKYAMRQARINRELAELKERIPGLAEAMAKAKTGDNADLRRILIEQGGPPE